MKYLPHIPAFVLASLAAFPLFANMEYDGDISYGYNNNISNAANVRDIFEDQFVSANFNVGKLWVPQPGRSFLLSGHLGTEQFDDSEGLNRFSYGSSISYIQRLGLGAYAPRFNVSLRADKRNFETNMRDGWLYRASFSLEKRLLPELRISATLSREKRTADANLAMPYTPLAHSDVFNQQNSEFSTSIDYTLGNNSMLTARYLYRDGEINVSTNPGSEFFAFSKAIAKDYELCNTCQHYVVYLVNASVQSFLLDWNWALGRDTSLSFNVERRIANADGDVSYSGNTFKIQLNRRF